jgi:hypothetical protein
VFAEVEPRHAAAPALARGNDVEDLPLADVRPVPEPAEGCDYIGEAHISLAVH